MMTCSSHRLYSGPFPSSLTNTAGTKLRGASAGTKPNGGTGIAAALPLHATSLTVASSPPSDLSQATVDRAWAYATPPASEILGQVVT